MISSGVHILGGTGIAPQFNAKGSHKSVDDDDVDPLLGQPLCKAVITGTSCISDEEKAAMQAEDQAKSAAYAAVEEKAKTQKQL
jgi:recombinational DNA repair protein (RecF pathway)